MLKVSINDAKRLAKRCVLTNIVSGGNINITPVLRGLPGVGKSELCGEQLAKELHGYCIVLSKNTIKEGEITGLPVMSGDAENKKQLTEILGSINNSLIKIASEKGNESAVNTLPVKPYYTDMFGNLEDSNEVTYVPYYATKRIQKLEKYYFYKLIEKPERLPNETAENYAERTKNYGGGMLGGRLVIKSDGLLYLDGKCVIAEEDKKKYTSEVSAIINGNTNKYKILNEIPANIRLDLLEKGDIAPIVLFIDELNRGSLEVMQELMNICLNKEINGYKLPWFVQIVSAINPADSEGKYATIEFDLAHKDRLLIIDVYADIQEFADYAAEHQLDNEYIAALMRNPSMFTNSYTVSDDDVVLSPRAHTMVSYLLKYKNAFNKYTFFNPYEITPEQIKNDVRTLAEAKIGDSAARALFQAMENSKNAVDFYKEILNPEKISEETLYKFDERNPERVNSYVMYCLSSILVILNNEQSRYLKDKEAQAKMCDKINSILEVSGSIAIYYYGKHFVNSKKYITSGLYAKIYKTVKKATERSKETSDIINLVNDMEEKDDGIEI